MIFQATTRQTYILTQQAAMAVYIDRLAPTSPQGRKSNFTYCSGEFVEREEERPLWFLEDARKISVRLMPTLQVSSM
jgi:hypothetical protein